MAMTSEDRSQRAAYGAGEPVLHAAPAGIEPPALPPAPEFDRHVTIQPLRLLGLLLIALAPAAALFGLFGEARRTVAVASEGVELSVSYPLTQRFKVRAPLRITVTNRGNAAIPLVEVALATHYLRGFADVAMTPGPDRVTADAYLFELTDLGPGETRQLALEMQAQDYWRTRGQVAWRELGAAGRLAGSGSVEFATLTWP